MRHFPLKKKKKNAQRFSDTRAMLWENYRKKKHLTVMLSIRTVNIIFNFALEIWEGRGIRAGAIFR